MIREFINYIVDLVLPVLKWVIEHWIVTLLVLVLLIYWAVRGYRTL